MKPKQEVNPLTGGGASCTAFPLIDKAEAPKEWSDLDYDPIFQTVFGAMEKLRIEESQRCQEKRREYYRMKQREYSHTHPDPFAKFYNHQGKVGRIAIAMRNWFN